MTTSTLHFGPEWMRTKQPAPRSLPEQTLPPPTTAPPSNASTYSALVSPAQQPQSDTRDDSHPFRYSKDELLQIFRDGAGQAGLGLEVERWEGVVREVSTEPTALREMGEAEKKLFAGSLNSDLRRRQSTDYLSPLSTQNLASERPRLNHNTTATANSPLRDRFGPLGRRRGESTDQIPGTLPRKLSLSSIQSPMSPRDPGMPSPRVARMGAGFDGGVFTGGGESWTARRRASEGAAKTPGILHRDPIGELQDAKIKEEDETPGQTSENLDKPLREANNPTAVPYETLSTAGQTSIQNIEPPVSHLPLHNESNHSSSASPANSSVGFAPPGLTDLASIEWSYLDPLGNVQGPFRADVMQKWHDEGYFTPDLLMKRTQIDTDWTSVAVLTQRATGPLFLTPQRPPLPPVLQRHDPHSPMFPHAEPFPTYQPAPVRSLRSSTLDSFLGGSNPSDSPSSSLGAGRYSNGSPDPSAFGGRAGNFVPGQDLTAVGRRAAFYEPSTLPHSIGIPTRSATLDSGFSTNQSPWPQANGVIGFDPLATGRGPADVMQYNPYQDSRIHSTGLGGSNNFNSGIPREGLPSNHYDAGHFDEPRVHDNSNFTPLNNFAAQPPSQSSFPSQVPVQSTPDPSAASVSPWGSVQKATPRQPGPFDSNYPTSSNTVSESSSPWATSSSLPRAGIVKPADSSPWSTLPVEPLANGAAAEVVPPTDRVNVEAAPQSAPPPAPAPAPEPSVEPAPVDAVPSKKRTKASKPTLSVSQATVGPPSPASAPSPAVPEAASKPAWAKSDDAKPSGVSLSLRDIQDAEARKADARKIAEKERERARANAAPSTPAEDVQPFTSSWGLPTSQVGVRNNVKETATPSATSPATATPVWTNTVKAPAVKKTMKEIQEEEEKRKKLASKESVASVAARRGYAETTVKQSVPPSQGGAWTTVGASGKSTPSPAVAPATRPPLSTTTSSSAVPGSLPRSNGVRTPAAPIPTKPAAPVPGKEEYPAAPSHEFLKWLSESLQGLNKSVNVEEIIQMLLSFAIDPDASTVELISDLIYSNSTILDGRRFAADFVSKRKADAAARAKSGASSASGANKPISIADVVKAQPKPQTSEWGGFKVVNKKKKGGRS
ncbi:hypothetical protein BDZ89DRAFT_1156583 [Hymenopellis radicata]|nr:hypothetical protein BDZ89DRAFT_1156583 [Hymenopellis radicata]